jgi:RNA polymerase-binding transcription factor DksA
MTAKREKMDSIKADLLRDKLERRKRQILLTLHHLDKEQKEAKENKDWMGHITSDTRDRLLDRLSHWYLAEAAKVDRAIWRINSHDYGFCAGCHRPIEMERLEPFPESERCLSCQDRRDSLHAA